METRLYPLGIQTFENIIDGHFMYVDKTQYIYRMSHTNGKYFFLSRPRRFGKSLLLSTMKSYFQGKRELFKGLALEKLEKEWTAYPVLHFSMASGKHMEKGQLEDYLDNMLRREEKTFGLVRKATSPNDRLSDLIHHCYEKTGKQVVVLIDEYDAPLLDVVHEDTQLPVLRNVMRNFYSPLKDCDPYLRFVFLTGITKFSQLSIFSELNNIKNISMLPDYAGICGITREELLTQLSADIDALADSQRLTRQQAVERLQANYDGYHFTWPSTDIYNPYSLLNCFADKMFDQYWFSSGTPTYLIEMMRKFGVIPSDIGEGIDAIRPEFDAPTESMESITPLLYQSGYLTIKDYDPFGDVYHLGIPNKEIRVGLFLSLLPLSQVSRPPWRARRHGHRQDGVAHQPRRHGRRPAAHERLPRHRPLLRQHPLRGPLPTVALRDVLPADQLPHAGGGAHPHGPRRRRARDRPPRLHRRDQARRLRPRGPATNP